MESLVGVATVDVLDICSYIVVVIERGVAELVLGVINEQRKSEINARSFGARDLGMDDEEYEGEKEGTHNEPR